MPSHRETDDVQGFMDLPRLEPQAEELLIEPVKHAAVKDRREGSTLTKIGIGFGVVTVLLSVVTWAGLDRADRAVAEAGRNTAQANALYTALKTEQKAKTDKGEPLAAPPADAVAEDPSVVPAPATAPGPVAVPGRTGEVGPRGPAPSAAEVAQAVASYCVVHAGCRGPGGAVGPSVTPAQVAAAVTTYCNGQGACRGPVGVPGPVGSPGIPGKDGEDGQGVEGPIGPQGPGPSDEQVATAVGGFCSQDSQPCRGPAGEMGPRGIGITQITCEGDDVDSFWRIVYSDGDIRNAVGPCRIGPAPEPTP